jgi:eukaryotic translation initiation factor 2C
VLPWQEKYQITLKYPDLPLLLVHPKSRGLKIPMELAKIKEGQVYKKQLKAKDQAQAVKIQALTCKDRSKEIQNVLDSMKLYEDPALKDFGIMVEQKPMQVKAKVLPQPQLEYGPDPRSGRNMIMREDRNPGQWNLKGTQFLSTHVELNAWGVANFCSRGDLKGMDPLEIIESLTDGFRTCGIKINSRPQIVDANPRDIVGAFNELGRRIHEGTPGNPTTMDLFICLIPKVDKKLWRDIKRASEVDLAVDNRETITQCVTMEKMFKGGGKGKGKGKSGGKSGKGLVQAQFSANVAMKVNMKLGGQNLALHEPQLSLSEPTMICGAGLSTCAPGQISQTYAAVVGSRDNKLSQYATQMCAQPADRHHIVCLRDVMEKLLQAFSDENQGILPSSIYFYRDGLTEGQLGTVKIQEAGSIRQAARDMGIPDLKLTYIAVQKSHTMRMFPADPNAADSCQNVRPGVVVDRDVTNPADFDFYLQSHSGLKGAGMTRMPKYVVAVDDHQHKPVHIHNLTYQLCYLFARCTRAVHVPAPVYYANIAADRARIYDGQDVYDDSLSQSTQASIEEKGHRLIPIPTRLCNRLFYL